MRRYFYSGNTLVAKWLEKNAFAKSHQDQIYRSAFLAALKNANTRDYDSIREQILDMTIAEQLKYANNLHIEQLFTQFHCFYKYSRGREMIVDSNSSQETTALVDPDKFPIWDLKQYSPVFRSLWGHYLAQMRYDIGFQPIVRDSQVEHVAGGRGVYLVFSNFKKKVEIGDFIGLVPGKIFSSLDDFKNTSLKKMKHYQCIPQHLHFPSGKILVLGDLSKERGKPYGLSETTVDKLVDGTYHNPFAIGHMINHPPPGIEANVCFGEISLGLTYFPRHLLRYLPYEYYTVQEKQITLFGVFALKEIQDREQLFVNYNQSHIYPIDDIPEWLLQPPKFSQIFAYLKKGEYEVAESGYWKHMQKKAMKRNVELYQKYEKMKIMRPDRVEFQDGERRYQRLKLRMEDQNQYEHI